MAYLMLFLFLSVTLSYADSCEEIRLDKKGEVMEKIPAIDQGEFGICYAVAATQVFDAFRQKQDPQLSQRSSVYHAAMMYAVDSKDPFNKSNFSVDGGYPSEAIKILIKNGSCDRKFYDQKIDVKKIQKLLSEMLQLKKAYDHSTFFKKRDNFTPYEPAPYGGPEKMSSLQLKKKMEVNSMIEASKHAYSKNPSCLMDHMNDLGIKDKKGIMDLLYKGEMAKFRNELLAKICPKNNTLRVGRTPKIVTPTDSLTAIYDKKFKSLNNDMNKFFALDKEFNKINSSDKDSPQRTKFIKNWVGTKLQQNRLPISISYCATKIGSPFVNMMADDCGHHASVIIGRKKNSATGKCQILIQNSWGKTKNSWLIYNKNVKAEGENFWVDEEQIYSSKSLSLFTLE